VDTWLTESLKNSKTLSKFGAAVVGSQRHPAADDATGKSFEGDGRGSFASRKNRETSDRAPGLLLPEALASPEENFSGAE